ncbi:MAG: hypothetical protein VX347_01130 [Bacteroidota bacterium]|nr:hypothetical protein [Bacteroidota bacterium]
MKRYIVLISIILMSCSNTKDSEKNIQDTLEFKKEEVLYSIDPNKVDIIWGGFKTTEKVKVVGVFEEFSFDRNGEFFPSIEALLSGMKFEIQTNSSNSGDPIRDLNLTNNFFKLVTKEFIIKGAFGDFEKDSVTVNFDLFSESAPLKLAIDFNNSVLQLKGKVNMKTQFKSSKAFDRIHEVCYELHKGNDGISKTWEEVDIHIKASIITK